jgi:hypothetical protein
MYIWIVSTTQNLIEKSTTTIVKLYKIQRNALLGLSPNKKHYGTDAQNGSINAFKLIKYLYICCKLRENNQT